MAAKKITEETILGMYMEYVLEHEKEPKSVYKFCKENKIKEEEFYNFFGSLDSLQKSIWNTFYTKTIDLIEKNKEYDSFSNRDKMLTFFFTFFELLTLNRSYVLFTLDKSKGVLENMAQLKELRTHIKSFATVLLENDTEEKTFKLTKHLSKVSSEGAWFQFLFLLKFWMDDSSAKFEKTDVAIEKSVNTIFDLLEYTPLENVIDFGKFLYKEKFA